MSDFIDRCRGLIVNRGVLGFAGFVLKRVVRRTKDIVFDRDPRDMATTYRKALPSELAVHVIDSQNVSDSKLTWIVDQALTGENSIYRDGLNNDSCLVAVTKGQLVVHFSFVQFDTSYKKILNESNSTPLIGNCWTSPECRGQGIYPFAIKTCLDVMASRGYERVLISCAPDNIASIAGIEKAGFGQVRRVDTVVVLTKLMIQKLEVGDIRRYRLGFL